MQPPLRFTLMDDLIRQALIVLRGMWQRRWIGLVAAWSVAIVGAAILWRIPDRFEASARIYVDTQSVLAPLMKDLTVELDIDQQVSMLSRILVSRPNVEKLIRMADLDVGGKSKDALVDHLMSGLQITGTGGRDNNNNLYTISFRDSNRARAKRVVESLAAIFIESSRGRDRQGSVDAKAFIEEQIKSYEKKLEEAENRLKAFRLSHVGLPEGGRDFFGSMNEANTRLNEARLQLREAENSRDALKRQISGEEPVLAGPAGPVPEIDARINSLKSNLDTLLQRFTEQHPDVVGTKRIIAELEEQRRRDLAARAKAGTSAPMTSDNANPVYQEIKVSLATADANVASLRTRVAEYEARYNQLKESARMMPEVQAEFAKLNRDYEINKKNYEALVARRESAEISGQMQAADGVVEFRLVEPPRVSDKPVAPNRLMLVPLMLIGALGAGIFASFAAYRAWPTFSDGRSLREVTGLPVLGAVSLRTTEEGRKKARHGLFGFFSALASLIAVFVAAFALLLFVSMRSA